MQVAIRLANMSFTVYSGPSQRDEAQLRHLVNKHRKKNGHVKWTIVEKEFCPQDKHRWGATSASALRNLHKRREKRKRYTRGRSSSSSETEDEVLLLSENEFLVDDKFNIDISPHFDGFDEVLSVDETVQMILAYIFDDSVKGI